MLIMFIGTHRTLHSMSLNASFNLRLCYRHNKIMETWQHVVAFVNASVNFRRQATAYAFSSVLERYKCGRNTTSDESRTQNIVE